MNTQLETTIQVLEHIIRLHSAGIVADEAKVDEERKEFIDSINKGDIESAAIELADLRIARLSFVLSESSWSGENYSTAIAKNNRRLDWMEAHPDPTKTPVELWKMAKVALGEVEA